MIQIIPAIDIIEGATVRLTKGEYSTKRTYDCTPLEMALKYKEIGIRRIHLVDLDGAREGKPMNLDTLELLASQTGLEIEWGGGITTREALEAVFTAGASNAIIGSIAAREPQLFESWLKEFGGRRITLGADLKNGAIAVRGWTETCNTSIEILVERFSAHGLDEVICTDIARDGMLEGPSFALYQRLQTAYPNITFTASGGISCMQDIKQLNALGIRRVIVGKAIYEHRIKLEQIQQWLQRE